MKNVLFPFLCGALFLSGCYGADVRPRRIPLDQADAGVRRVDDARSDVDALNLDTGLLADAADRDATFQPDALAGDTGVEPDATLPDQGFADSGGADAQMPDRGLADAGFASDAVVPADAGYRPDARLTDSGLSDTGIQADARSVDSGFADSGFADAGQRDAGFADAGQPDVGVLLGYVLIQPGSFVMGSPRGELGAEPFELPQHQVTITRSFWMKREEVTQGEWLTLMGNNPSRFQACGNNCPVERVSWNEVVAYLNALSRREGLPECYSVVTRGSPPQQIYELIGLTCRGYRLPTEAEWEYAARAGSTTAFSNGPITDRDCSDSALSTVGWYCGNAMGRTWPIAQKPANAWGLHDMHGNVQEWTDTCYGGAYSASPRTDPIGPSGPCDKVNRGGAWSRQAIYHRCASRNWSVVDTTRLDNLGFRCVRTVP